MGNTHKSGILNENFLKVKVGGQTGKAKRRVEVNKHLTLANEDSNV